MHRFRKEKEECLAYIIKLWDDAKQPKSYQRSRKTSASVSTCSDQFPKNNSINLKRAFVEVEGSTVNLYGNGMILLDKIETTISKIHFNYLSISDITSNIPHLLHFDWLTSLIFESVNFHSFRDVLYL